MSIRKLQDSGQRSLQIQADVCVVGAGLAGLFAAVQLARRHRLRVVVLESGALRDDRQAQQLDRIDNPTPNYQGELRTRGPGGTSVLWAGKLLPLSPLDMSARPWLELPAWPIPQSSLARYTPEIERQFAVDGASYEEEAAPQLDPGELLPREDADFSARWPKRPTPANHDVAHVLREQLAQLDNLELWLGTTVTDFRFAPDSTKLQELEARNLDGQTLRVQAREFMLAAGTLESTRLLLVADRRAGGAISRETDALGRHFNDHLGLHVARLVPRDAARVNRMFADRWPLGADRHLHFELRPEVQERERVGSSYFDFSLEVPESSALTQTRHAVAALRARKLPLAAMHTARALPDASSLLWTAHWQYLGKQKYWPTNGLTEAKIWIEQLPHHASRIQLSERCDALGMPRIHVALQRSEHEERSFRACATHLARFWTRHVGPACELAWCASARDEALRMLDAATEQAHPAGSARMGLDRASSVVDPQLRVHAIANLSVASAAVFPSSGSANPSLTIIQLALLAADATAARLSGR